MPVELLLMRSRSINGLSRQFQSGDWHETLVEDVNQLWQKSPNRGTLSLLLRTQQAIRGFTADELAQIVDYVVEHKRLVSPSVALRLTSLLSQVEPHERNAFPERYLTTLGNLLYRMCRRQLLASYPTLLKDHSGFPHVRLADEFCNRLIDWSTFTNTLGPGRIAIVGNATTELGRRQGHHIDQATHVIRFNNVNTEPDFAADYGTKTTAWVISPSHQPEASNLAASTLLVSGIDPFHKPTRYWSHLAALPLEAIVTFPRHVWYQLVAKLEAPPTAGLLTLASLLDSDKTAVGTAVYGMTRTAPTEEQNHYGDSGKKSTRHNWQKEALLTDQLITKIESASHES